jgi:hypothetical protein
MRMRRSGVGWLAALGALACALLLMSVAVSSAYASAGFGIERYGLTATNEDGSADAQAGSHPYELTAEAGLESGAQSASEVRDLNFELPPGLTLDPSAVPPCTYREFTGGTCPNEAAVGVSGGMAPVDVECQAAACRGSIELTVQVPAKDGKGKTAAARTATLVLAKGSFSLAEGKRGTVVLHLTAVGKKRLAHASRRYPVAAKLVLSVQSGKTTTKSVLAV